MPLPNEKERRPGVASEAPTKQTEQVATTIPPGTDIPLRDPHDESQLALAAIDYARRGWPVFPVHDMTTGACSCGRACDSPGKHPRTVNGFKDATVDLDQVAKWWWYNPDANIGIATGAPGPDVLDVDVKPTGTGWPAFDTLRRSGRLTGAFMLVSTRNGGAHVYFTGTDQLCGAIPKMFIDFKAAGGYVLAPPSRVPADDYAPQGTGRYELVWSRGSDMSLDWASCRALLTPPPRRAVAMSARAKSAATPDDLPKWLCDRLAEVPPKGHRSGHFHSIVGGCAYAGLDLAQTIRVLESWPPGVDKYGARLAAEVERSWTKIGGAA
jgi:hypothetical protein